MTETIVFKNAFLIDGTGNEPTPDARVVVEGGKIKDVVDGNPLEDIGLFENARERVLLVLKEGKIMKDIRDLS
jgi:hypothetical protein